MQYSNVQGQACNILYVLIESFQKRQPEVKHHTLNTSHYNLLESKYQMSSIRSERVHNLLQIFLHPSACCKMLLDKKLSFANASRAVSILIRKNSLRRRRGNFSTEQFIIMCLKSSFGKLLSNFSKDSPIYR